MKLKEKAPELRIKFRSEAQRKHYMRSIDNMNKVSPVGKDIPIGGANSHPSRVKKRKS